MYTAEITNYRMHRTISNGRSASYGHAAVCPDNCSRSRGNRRAAIIRRRRKQKAMIRSLCIMAAVLSVICIMIFQVNIKNANAASPAAVTGRTKYYTSIQVKCGDSLWAIAQRYCSEEYADLNDYIREVKEINHLNSDVIRRGYALCVPYYAEQKSSD